MIRCKYLYIIPLVNFSSVAYDFLSSIDVWLKQPLNAMIVFVLFFLTPSAFSFLSMAGLLKKDKGISFSFFAVLLVFSLAYSWGVNDERLIMLCAANSILTGCIALFLKSHYKAEDVRLLQKSNNPAWVIKSITKSVLKHEVEKRLVGKVHPKVIPRVAGGIAAGALTESLSSGRSDLFSDGLIPAAMSIADSHLTTFESEGYSGAGSHVNEFNPATGLAMTSDYFDAGGDAYGSSLNHDHMFDMHSSFDNDFSSSFDNHSSFDSGSSFSGGFDDNNS